MKTVILSTMAALALMTGAAFSSDTTKFFSKQAGSWTVEGIKSDTTFCGASTFWDETANDRSFAILYVTTDGEMKLMVHDIKWNIDDPVGAYEGYKANVRFFSKTKAPDSGTADYEVQDNQTVVFVRINTDFVKSFSSYGTMSISMPGNITRVDIPLDGSTTATSYLGECVSKMDAAKNNSSSL